MADVKWIKITTDIFDDEKILMIESMPSADSIIVIWFKLLAFAGKQNNDGVFLMSNRIAFTDEMLGSIFRRELSTIRLALKVFEQFGMIEIVDNVITIPNWHKHQTLDAYEKKKQRDRLYQQERRAAQRALVNGNTQTLAIGESSDTSSDESSDASPDTSSYVAISEEEKDLRRRQETITVSKDTVCSTDVQRIVANWNALGLSQIKTIKAGTKRHEMLKKRIKDYGVEAVLEAIARIQQSSFLTGNNKNGWVITFDWFVKPNNFPKVYEGNYDDGQAQARREKVRNGQITGQDDARAVLERVGDWY